MIRSKKIAVVAHCLLNVNSKVEGLAKYKGVMKKMVSDLIENDYGIIQLPCPETSYMGIKRWGMSFNQYNFPSYQKYCNKLLLPIVNQIEDYLNNGYIVEKIVCIDGSPSCGLNRVSVGLQGGLPTTAYQQLENVEIKKSKGVFIEQLEKLLKERELKIEFIAIDEEEDQD